jgi:hypothetical protein
MNIEMYMKLLEFIFAISEETLIINKRLIGL